MRRHDVQDGTGTIERIPGYGIVQAWGTAAPTASASGYAPGCLYHKVNGTVGSVLYVNTGTGTSATWLNIA